MSASSPEPDSGKIHHQPPPASPVNAGIIGGGGKMLSGVNGGGFGGPMPGLGFPPNLGGLPGFPGGPRPPGFREDAILSICYFFYRQQRI